MKNLIHALLLVVSGMLAAALIWLTASPPRGEPVLLHPPPTPPPLQVHVTGAVSKPGVYPLAPGARLQEAIEAAGGIVEVGDLAGLNLAMKLSDGDRVEVPFLPPTRTPTASPGSTAVEAPQTQPSGAQAERNGLININLATQSQLETLPGIGPATAQKIIAYREDHGPFEIISDIVNVSGIGPATYDKIKDSITVGDMP